MDSKKLFKFKSHVINITMYLINKLDPERIIKQLHQMV